MGFIEKIQAAAKAVESGASTPEQAAKDLSEASGGGLTEYGASDVINRQLQTGNPHDETIPFPRQGESK